MDLPGCRTSWPEAAHGPYACTVGNKLQPFRRGLVRSLTRRNVSPDGWYSANLNSGQEGNTMTIPRGVGLAYSKVSGMTQDRDRRNNRLANIKSYCKPPDATIRGVCVAQPGIGTRKPPHHSQRHRTIRPMTPPIQQKQKVNPVAPCVRAEAEALEHRRPARLVSRSRSQRRYCAPSSPSPACPIDPKHNFEPFITRRVLRPPSLYVVFHAHAAIINIRPIHPTPPRTCL